jgi:hypothetical protein
MSPTDLNQAVAQATGETVYSIRHLGFQLADRVNVADPEPSQRAPNVVDWDALETERHIRRTWRPYHELAGV